MALQRRPQRSNDRDRGRDRDSDRHSTIGGGSRGRFSYQPRSPEQFSRQMNRSSSRFDSPVKLVQMFRPAQGDNQVRLLPPTWDNAEHYAVQVWAHTYIGEQKATYLCPRKMLNKPCPVCDAYKEEARRGDPEIAKKLSPKPRWLAYILDRDGENPEKPMVWMYTDQADQEILMYVKDRRTGEWLPVDDPDNGYDLIFRRTGPKGLGTRYGGYQFDRDPSPLSDDQRTQDEILDFIRDNPLPSILQYYPEEYLEEVVAGTVVEGDDELDDADDRRGGGRDDRRTPGRSRDRDEERQEGREASRSRSRRGEPVEEEYDNGAVEAEANEDGDIEAAAGDEQSGDEPNIADQPAAEEETPRRRAASNGRTRARADDEPPGRDRPSRPAPGRRQERRNFRD